MDSCRGYFYYYFEPQKRSRVTKLGAQTQHRVIQRFLPPFTSKQSEILCARDKGVVFGNIGQAISGSTARWNIFLCCTCRKHGSKFPRLFTVHFFCLLEMVTFSRNLGYKWFAVMVFTLSRLEHGWFRRNSVCCGPVYGPWLSLRFGYGSVYDSRLSVWVGFGPVCTRHLSSRTATSPMPSTLGMHSPLRTNSSIFLHPPSPQQPPLVPIAHPGGIVCVFFAAQQLRRCTFEPPVGIPSSTSETSFIPP